MKKRKLKGAALAAGICLCLLFNIPAYGEEQTEDPAAASQEAVPAQISTNSIDGWPQGPEITSQSAVVMEESTDTVLYAKDMDQIQYPAGTVKIMTCLLALENSQLTDQVTMTETGVSGVTDGGASISAQLDETFTMEQCLYAMMLASANDIALQVAEHVSGSVDAFVAQMNERASQLGCTNTVFTNPTGLPDTNQHTTAHDMALIMKAAISNETFRTIAGASTYTIPATNVSGGIRSLTSSFAMTNNTSPVYYEGCIGGKESYTNDSGSTLVCAAQRNGTTLICVVLKGAADQTDPEAVTLLDYGFGNFQKLDLSKNDFDILSGGTVMVPSGTTADALTFQDSQGQDYTDRQYFFNGAPVGTSQVDSITEDNDEITKQGASNMQEAKEFSESHSKEPFYVIGAIGFIILLLLIWKMIRIIKS
ncbi:MAG: D-alanyl-D-alanine carboxypeptidase [Clostridia bacterium]|nr:D-alanyl-D-alanine carboxypeptidase [Clostridia bacterium]MDY5554772.1 D-alanyl-D-alanine carboxypeptidase family protein [Blautia sp.]